MSQPDFENLPTRLGVYTLTERLGQHELTDLYLATQSHVERGVVVQVLHADSSKAEVDYFLRMVRAKGGAELPGVSQVLESMLSGNIWFLTHEQPRGRSLVQMAHDGVHLSTRQACSVISAASRLYSAAAENGLATEPLGADSIFVHGEDKVRFLSPVLPGEHDATREPACMQALAEALMPVLPQNVAGQTRVATLVSWLHDGYEGNYLDWETIGLSAAAIDEQTAPLLTRNSVENLSTRAISQKFEHKRARRQMRRSIISSSISVLVVLAMAGLGVLLAPSKGEKLPERDGGLVYVREGKNTVRVSEKPVSIDDYRRFLLVYEDIAGTSQAQRAAIVRGIPENCRSFTPLEWKEQLQAAERGTAWRGERLTGASPVRGVSYWGAQAYANYKSAILPSAPMLRVVRQAVPELTVPSEWTTTIMPAGALYEQGWVVLPPTGREWPDVMPDRSACHVNFGFRLAYPLSEKSE